VDVLHRVRDVAEQSRLVSLREAPAQIFLRKTKAAEKLRHHFQHFRSGIQKLPDATDPLFGTLSWVSTTNPQQCFSLMSGTAHTGVQSYGCTYDMVDRVYCQRLLLAAGSAGMDVDLGFTALQEFERHLGDYLGLKGAKSLIDGPLGQVIASEVQRAE
jgi:hypothetical protein